MSSKLRIGNQELGFVSLLSLTQAEGSPNLQVILNRHWSELPPQLQTAVLAELNRVTAANTTTLNYLFVGSHELVRRELAAA